MSKYDDLFDEAAPDDSVFADKGVLDPLAEPNEIIARDEQETALARILSGVHEGYLPATVSIYGPPGTGKTMTTRRVSREFAARTEDVAIEYVNLKECRTLFSAANEILFELTRERKQAYEGLDGVFEGIWSALEEYPEYTILILDEIDHVKRDSNYDPNEFFYRLLRGEGKLKRGITLSLWLLSNELLDVDLRLDSRVKSAMANEEVFFPLYSDEKLAAIMIPRLRAAFKDETLPDDTAIHGIHKAAFRWGDVRKTLTLFRQAGEVANERGLTAVSKDCIDENIESTDREAIEERLLSLPSQHFVTLLGVVSWEDQASEEIAQPVTTTEVKESYNMRMSDDNQSGDRAIRETITELETMGLLETWMQSKGNEGRAKQVQTTFDPVWVQELYEKYLEQSNAPGNQSS